MKPTYKTRKVLTQFIFFFGLILQLGAQPNYPRTVEEAKLIASDVANFIAAYELLEPGIDTISILDENYFSKASAGLTEYIQRHGLTPAMLKAAIEKDPEVYNQIADFYQQLPEFDALFRDALSAYQNVIPNAIFAPTYLIVGANRGIAQASRPGQLVTITRLLDNPEKLIQMIVHELTHFQQAMALGPEKYIALYSATDNMLDLCLREGGAEFVTFLVLDDITQSRPLDYFEEHIAELDQRFLEDLDNQDPSYWLWDSVGKDKDQHLLGYVIGFRICQAYYHQAESKESAIQEILGISDADGFLDSSGYFN